MCNSYSQRYSGQTANLEVNPTSQLPPVLPNHAEPFVAPVHAPSCAQDGTNAGNGAGREQEQSPTPLCRRRQATSLATSKEKVLVTSGMNRLVPDGMARSMAQEAAGALVILANSNSATDASAAASAAAAATAATTVADRTRSKKRGLLLISASSASGLGVAPLVVPSSADMDTDRRGSLCLAAVAVPAKDGDVDEVAAQNGNRIGGRRHQKRENLRFSGGVKGGSCNARPMSLEVLARHQPPSFVIRTAAAEPLACGHTQGTAADTKQPLFAAAIGGAK